MATSSYDTKRFHDDLQEAAEVVRRVLGEAEVALVLGSGLNGFIDVLEERKELSYSDIPHMPTTTVKGHYGRLASGKIGGLKIFCLAGRSHAYEGKDMYQLTFTARLMRALGCRVLIATNASGGCGEGMVPGCLMVITDHINLFHRNPLAETFEDRALGVRRPTLSDLYSARLREKALSTAAKLNLKLWEGVYVSECGPTYETPAEVQAGRILGGSAFGMSTIPEVVAARSIGMEVFAMSLITNLAAGMAAETITHSHVQMVADVAGPGFVNFMREFIRDIATNDKVEHSNNAAFLPSKHENPEATTIASLPQPTYAPATGSQVNAAADYVLAHGVGENVLADVALYFAPSHGSGLIKRLKDARSIPYRDIPHFPSVSISSRQGELVVGTLACGKRVVVLHRNALEGFSCEESVFVARLLRTLGVSTLIQTLVAEKRGVSKDMVGDVALLVDAADFTTIHPWTHNRPIRPLQTALPLIDDSTAILREELAKAFETSGLKVSREAAYMAFQGPSLPSNAEASIAHRIGCQLIGTSSLGLLYAARSNGISVAVLAQPVDISDNAGVSKAHVSRALESALGAHSPAPAQPIREADDLPTSVYHNQQVTNHLARSVIQGVFDHIKAAADHIQRSINGETSPVAVVVEDDDLFQPLVHHFAQLNEIPDIPHMPPGVHFYRGQLKESNVPAFVCRGVHYIAEGRPFSEISFPVQLLHGLGVGRVLMLGRSAAVRDGFDRGDVLLVNDHINFSGRNPLFGPNEERWGVRFPDMSNAYDASIRNEAADVAQAEGVSVKRAVVGLFVGPLYRSSLDAAFARTCGADVLTTGMIAQVIVARHVGLKVGAISLVSGSLVAGDESEKAACRLEDAAANVARITARLLPLLANAKPDDHTKPDTHH